VIDIKYNFDVLNSIEGIAGISSKKKVHYFLHQETYFLCNRIYKNLKKIDTKSEVERVVNELTEGSTTDYKSTLIVHKKAHLMALRSWHKKKKGAQDQEIKISSSTKKRYADRTIEESMNRGGVEHNGETRTFNVKHLKSGLSLTRIKSFKTLRKSYFVRQMTFKEVQDFYEEKYRKSHSGNIARIFLLMGRYAKDTRKGFSTSKGYIAAGSNSVDYDFQDTSVKMDFHSDAFGKKHFTEETFEINPWLTRTKSEGKNMYEGSRNEEAINRGIYESWKSVYNHVKEKGLLYNK
jgi:hypothetical protein